VLRLLSDRRDDLVAERTRTLNRFGDLRRHRMSREREHYQRKLTEAKTPAEARRSLKRQLSNVIYKRLLADHQRAAASMT